MSSYTQPEWFAFPPFFTLQPNLETRARQEALWKAHILDYCRHHRVFIVNVEEESPLTSNPAVKRSLSLEARRAFLVSLVEDGRAEWLDTALTRCLVHWRKPAEWAALVAAWARGAGLEEGVATLDELAHGEETRGSELHGIAQPALLRALRVLEAEGRAKLFRATAGDDLGVKFFTQAGAGHH